MIDALASFFLNFQANLGTPLLVVSYTAVFGALGGLVAFCVYWIAEKDGGIEANKNNARNPKENFQLIAAHVIVGLGGSIGFLFVLIAIGGLANFRSNAEILRLISISVVAGFGAIKLLPMMVNSLADKINQASETAEKALHKVDDASTKVESLNNQLSQYKDEIDFLNLNQLLNAASHPECSAEVYNRAIEKYLTFKEHFPDRPIYRCDINLARVYRWREKYNEAIKHLDSTIEQMNKEANLEDAEIKMYFNIAHFNRGCYKSLILNDENKNDLLKSIFDDLVIAINNAKSSEKDKEAILSSDRDLENFRKYGADFCEEIKKV